jgi:hypothetical protein
LIAVPMRGRQPDGQRIAPQHRALAVGVVNATPSCFGDLGSDLTMRLQSRSRGAVGSRFARRLGL